MIAIRKSQLNRPMHPRKRLRRIINEQEQIIRDVTYWNGLNPNEKPFDVEGCRVILDYAKRGAKLWDFGQIDTAFAVMGQMVEYVKSSNYVNE